MLVGGTSLALQIGHRKSEDIDLFGRAVFNHDEIMEILNELGTLKLIKRSGNILICSLNDIKIDFVNYSYPWLEEPIIRDGIRMAGLKDIAAMKLNAIAGRGSRKDFVDVYYLLKYYSIDDLISFYLEKYNDGSEFLVRKSMTYFDDAEREAMPRMMEDVTWQEIRTKLANQI